jgi:hypothetical protein
MFHKLLRQALILLAVFALISVIALIFSSAPAHAASITPGVWYTVVNQGNGKCVDDQNGSTANGAIVQQYGCSTNNVNQQWQFIATSGGYYEVISHDGSNLAWDVTNVSTADAAPIQLWTYGGGNNQQWQPVALDSTHYKFVNRNDGKCLDVPSASTTDGMQLDQYTCNGTGAQSWSVNAVGGNPTNTPTNTATFVPPTNTPLPTSTGGGITPGTWYNVVNQGNGKCVDDQNGSAANGAIVQQWACNTSNANQQWQFIASSGGYYEVVSHNGSNLAWDVTNVSTADAAPIQLWAYGGGNNQQWQPVALDSTHYKFVNRNSGKCLDVPSASTTDGVQLDQYACNGTGAQSWSLNVGGTVPPTPQPGTWPSRYFAPYMEMASESDLTNVANTTGSKYFTLAFIIDNGGCNAVWEGTSNTMSSSFLVGELQNLRNAGGDVIVSFGGAAGNELALDCGSVSSLQAQYQAVISKYNVTHLDFDVEGSAISNTAANDRRNKALHNLQTANPNLIISYTLAVDTSGLPGDQINLLNNAVSNGTRVDIVNLMTMDYANDSRDMGAAATQAATSTVNQLKSVYPGKTTAQLWHMIGITPMIGVNDTQPETFTIANAQTVLSFSQSNNIGVIAMWSVSRDHGGCNGQLSDTCSGVSESNYGFMNIWESFTQ